MPNYEMLESEKISLFRKKVSSEFFQKLGPIIHRGNTVGYEKALRETLEDISGEIYSLLGIQDQPSEYYMTFHYSSVFTKNWHRSYLSPNKTKPEEKPEEDEFFVIKRDFFSPNKDYHTYKAFGRSYETLPKFFNLPIMDGVTEPIILTFSRKRKKTYYVKSKSTLYISNQAWKQLYEISKSSEVDRLFFRGEELDYSEIKNIDNIIEALEKVILAKKDNNPTLTLRNLADTFAQNNTHTPKGDSRDFIISCFFSTFIYSIWNFDHSEKKPLTIILVPSLLPSVYGTDSNILESRWWEKFPKLAALNLAYKGENIELDKFLPNLAAIAGVLADELFKLENIHREKQPPFAISEDVIRVACNLDNVVYYDINVGSYALNSLITKIRTSGRLLKFDEGFSEDEKEEIAEDVSEIIRDRLSGEHLSELCDTFRWASPIFTNFLDLLWNVALDPMLKITEQTGGVRKYCCVPDLPSTKVIFLYSEPGCGKETISQLIHHFSGRMSCLASKNTQRLLDKGDFKAVDAFIKNRNTLDKKGEKLSEFLILKKEDSKIQGKGSIDPICTYIPLNCAILDNKEVFKQELFGNYNKEDKLGLIPFLNEVAGTLFLDEFNTMPNPLMANEFLRVFEDPYEVYIPGRESPIRPIKLLVIIASNLTGDQLIEKGFNPAIVFRITKNYFCVPALRERKEDIAVFVNYLFSKAASHFAYKLKRIDPHAMRLLCELPWPDNYRGVNGLVDHILFKRRQAEIKHDEITYDEVLKAITERDVMKKVVSQGKTIHKIELIEKG